MKTPIAIHSLLLLTFHIASGADPIDGRISVAYDISTFRQGEFRAVLYLDTNEKPSKRYELKYTPLTAVPVEWKPFAGDIWLVDPSVTSYRVTGDVEGSAVNATQIAIGPDTKHPEPIARTKSKEPDAAAPTAAATLTCQPMNVNGQLVFKYKADGLPDLFAIGRNGFDPQNNIPIMQVKQSFLVESEGKTGVPYIPIDAAHPVIKLPEAPKKPAPKAEPKAPKKRK